MFELIELLEIINDNSIIILYNENQEKIGMYDGKESIEDQYNYCKILDVFSDNYNLVNNKLSAIGIEIYTEGEY